MNKRTLNTAQLIGSLLTFAGAALQLFEFEFSKYVFASGALSLIVVFFIYNYLARNENSLVRRHHRLMMFATLFLGIGAYLMFTNKGSWVVMVLIYALISVYLSFRGVEKKAE
ncbi:MAG: hypothetical protein ACYC2P_11300 [Paludibacteraceae bacterium]